MSNDSDTTSSKKMLLEVLRKVSVAQVNQYFECEGIVLVPTPPNHVLGQVLTRFVVMILLTGSEISMMFKVHFNPEQVRAYRRTQGIRAEDLTDKDLVDFMKELGNQIGGRASRVFQSNGIALGMSIPLCTRGIYEIYADYQEKSGVIVKFGDFWGLSGSFGLLYVSCCVELMAADQLKNFEYVDEQSDEGELDFL
ncbi:MAG: hypothetical protein V4858_29600 [Pseudomonadota bacterium]